MLAKVLPSTSIKGKAQLGHSPWARKRLQLMYVREEPPQVRLDGSTCYDKRATIQQA